MKTSLYGPRCNARESTIVRTFVAIEIPAEIRERLGEVQVPLGRSRARLTMVDPKSIHITLKFLGEVHEEKISTIAAALQMIVMTQFNVTVGPAGGNRRDRPRVIWSDIRDEGKCVALATAIDDRLAPLGFPREERPYHPHATVARVKEFDPSLISAIRSLPPGEFGSFTVEGFSLKKSTLTPDGPRYEDLCTIRWE